MTPRERFIDQIMPLLYLIWCIELACTALWSTALVKIRPDWVGVAITVGAWVVAASNCWAAMGVLLRAKNACRLASKAVIAGMATGFSPVLVAAEIAVQEQVEDGSPLATAIGLAFAGVFLGVFVFIPGLIGCGWLTSWHAFLRDHEP